MVWVNSRIALLSSGAYHMGTTYTVRAPSAHPENGLVELKYGRNRARTCDLPRVKRTLSQLSYAPWAAWLSQISHLRLYQLVVEG